MKPEDARPERSGGPAPDDTAAHPAKTRLWDQVFSRENLALVLRRVECNAGAALPPNNHMHHLTSRGRFRFGAITAALAAITHLATAQAPATTGVNPAAAPTASTSPSRRMTPPPFPATGTRVGSATLRGNSGSLAAR